jgi:hypothetical protein
VAKFLKIFLGKQNLFFRGYSPEKKSENRFGKPNENNPLWEFW